MTRHTTRRQRGFSLVELLVVVSIMAALFGLVVTGLRGAGKSNALRMAQDFASLLLSAQSRGLGRVEGAAVIIDADPADTLGRRGTELQEGAMSPPLVVTVTNGTLGPLGDTASAYKVRFREKVGDGVINVSPWLALANGVPGYRLSAGQTPANTILNPPGDNLEALVIRTPTKGSKPTRLTGPVVVDLMHSGVGDDPATPHGRFEGKHPIAIVFDQTGRVAEVITRVGAAGVEAIVPTEPIYFLFTDRQSITTNTSLTSERSFWVTIHPQTGRINVASNEPNSALNVARSKARRAIAVGK